MKGWSNRQVQALTPPAPGVLTINLGALVENWRRVEREVAPARAAAVVKADAYGLGAAQVVPALLAAGCGQSGRGGGDPRNRAG
jgi:alanine racemase